MSLFIAAFIFFLPAGIAIMTPVLPFGIPPLDLIATTVVLFFGLHVIVSYIGYKLDLKARPF